MSEQVMQRIGRCRLIPVLVIDDARQAQPLGEALQQAGLPIAEITFRTAAAEDAVRLMAQQEGLLVGAGTVLTVQQVDRAVDAGAQFVVTPGTNPKVVEHCLKRGIAVTPGVATATEIDLALSLGVTTLKFFPAEALGGVKMLKAVSAPFAAAKFIPTGGIGLDNLPHYLGLPSVVACGGSWLAPRDQLAAGSFDQIRQTVAQAVQRIEQLALPT